MRQIDGLREDDVQRLVSVRDGIPADLNPHLFAPQPAPNSIPPLGWQDPPRRLAAQADLPTRGRYGARGTAADLFTDVRDLWRRSGLKRASLEKLAAADAFRSLGLDRRQALWEVRGLPKELPLPLFDHADASRCRRRASTSRCR